MAFLSTSRYFRLPVVTDDDGQHVVLRPVPPLQPPAGSVTHTLVVGETLDVLAKRYYGQENLWWRIADANPAKHPDDWQPGDVIVVPPPSAARTRTG